MRDNGKNDWRVIILALFAFFCCLYLLTGLGHIDSYDGEMMYRVTASLVDRHSLHITDEIFHANQPYSVYGLGTSIFAIPLFIAGEITRVDTRWFASLLNPIVTAFTVAVVYDLASRFRFSRSASLFVALSFGLGSLAWPYAKTFFSEPLTCLWMVTAASAAFAYRESRSSWSLAITGISLGFAVLTREDTLLVVPAFVIYLGWPSKDNRRPGIAAVISLMLPLVLLGVVTLWYHEIRFHGFLAEYVAKTGNAFDLSPTTFFIGLYGFLASSGKGLVFYSPLVLLAPFVWSQFWRERPLECALFTFLIVERIAFFSFLIRWWGGVSWGPRYIVPILPFLLLPCGYAWSFGSRRPWLRLSVVGGTFVSSLIAQLPGVAITYPLYWNATIGTKTIVSDQIFFSPRWSPLFGQFHWMIQGTNVDWFLPGPSPETEWIMRSLLVAGMVFAAAVLFQAHRSSSTSHLPMIQTEEST